MFGKSTQTTHDTGRNVGNFNNNSNGNNAMQNGASPSAEVTRQQRQGRSARYANATLTPPVDVLEDSTGITRYADLPGVPRENLKPRSRPTP